MSRCGERGFTLVELLVVITIIALATAAVALALPTDGDVKRTAEQIAARAVSARNSAVIDGRDTRLALLAEGYRSEQRRNGTWQPVDGKPGALVRWPEGLQAQVDGALQFDTTGLAEPGTVTLRQGGRAAVVAIDAGGEVRVR